MPEEFPGLFQPWISLSAACGIQPPRRVSGPGGRSGETAVTVAGADNIGRGGVEEIRRGDRIARPVGGAVEDTAPTPPVRSTPDRPAKGYGRFMTDGTEVELAEAFGEIARTLLAENDAEATLERIVRLAVDTIDGCEHAGISMIEHKTVTSPASSDEIPAIVDRLQSETGEGPCVDAIKDHEVFQTGRLSQDHRWPNFARRASVESGIESILSFRLFAEEDTMGALNLYSTQPDAFDDHDVAIGAVFATHAAVAWSTARKIENLQAGLQTRQLIGTATGILMNRQGLSQVEAFDVLRRASQRLNIKLRLIAEQVIGDPKGKQPSNELDVVAETSLNPGGVRAHGRGRC